MPNTLQNLSPKMHSLESTIRSLMIQINEETKRIYQEVDGIAMNPNCDKLVDRVSYLNRLQSECLLTIGKEIDFFKK
jgi:hypothetical protein